VIIDMHAHYTPRGFLEAAKRGKSWYGWRMLHDAQGQEYLSLGERVFPFPQGSDLLNPEKRIQTRIAEQGIDFEALIVIGYMWNYHLEPKEGVAFCREVNQELADVQKAYPQHYRGLAILPMQDPATAVKEMEHAVKDMGLGSFAIAASVNGRNLDDPTVLPILEAAAAANVSLTVHGPLWGRAGEERFPRYYFSNSFGAPLESSLAVMSVIYSGLLDRYPDLRICFTHGGGWVPYGMGRFALRYQQREDARPMAASPETYLGRMYYDCLIHDSESLKLLVSRVGADHIVIGTDYPAGGDIPGGAANWIRQQPFLSGEDKEKILWRNVARFLGLPAAASG
jgi:aminocarboxymuconate-semialdehyde decarboxylase